MLYSYSKIDQTILLINIYNLGRIMLLSFGFFMLKHFRKDHHLKFSNVFFVGIDDLNASGFCNKFLQERWRERSREMFPLLDLPNQFDRYQKSLVLL
jgi:hypothetical protein